MNDIAFETGMIEPRLPSKDGTSKDLLRNITLETYAEAHRLMRPILWAYFAIYIILNFIYEVRPLGIFLFLVFNGVMEALLYLQPRSPFTRYYVGFMLMASACFMIDVAQGYTWMHFAVFTNLAFLLAYRDWKVILVAEVTIALHHLTFNYLQMAGVPVMVFRPEMLGLKMVVIHATFVVSDCAVLYYICRSLVQNMVDRARIGETLQRVMQVKGVAENNVKIQSEIEAIVGANRDLRVRSSRQAENLVDIKQHLNEFAQQLQDTVRQSEEVSDLSKSTASEAVQGQGVISELIEAINLLEKNSEDIFAIVEVIDEIAAQTNLLAINAAVQAASAGEHGRAFAVVAGEVRSLASRSADSSQKIREIIRNNVDQVGKGAELATESGTALSEMVAGIERVKQLMDGLRDANTRQVDSLSNINHAIESIDTMTQQNMTMVEELEQSSEHLYAESTTLSDRMSDALRKVSAHA